MENNATIGVKLKHARGDKTIVQVAKDNGISISAVSMYENNQRVPRDEIKLRLARYYDSSVESLFFTSEVH